MDHEALRRLITSEEGQYFDRKSLFHGAPGAKKHRDRKEVRNQVAEYVAAFANADGGTLVLGVENDGTITGCPYQDEADIELLRSVPATRLTPPQRAGTVVELEGARLLVFEVSAAARAVMVQGDGFPRREGDEVFQTSEEAINRFKDAGLVASPEARVARASMADLDPAALTRAVRAAGFDGSPEDYLLSRRLADRRGDDLALRQGAVWLFARSAAAIQHPNAGVRVFRVHGTEQQTGAQRNVQDYPWIEGGLVAVLEETQRLLTTLVRSSTRLHDLFFREMPEYPTFAWQEALVNALAHRDYGVESWGVEVWLYEDRLEVKSPGGLVAGVELEALRERRRAHASRNPRIARVLTELGIMRQQGEGIPRMIEEMELSWLPPPELRADDRQFVVVLRNEPVFQGRDASLVAAVRGLPLDVRQKRSLAFFGDGREFRSSDYQTLNRVDRDVAYRELSGLVDEKLVKTHGAGAGMRYQVALDRLLAGTAPPKTPLARLVERMQVAGRITNADYRDVFGVERVQATRALSALVASEALLPRGEKRGAHYVPGPRWPPQE